MPRRPAPLPIVFDVRESDDPQVREDWRLLWDDLHRRALARLASPALPAAQEEERPDQGAR
jgi:hypothetical protein